MAAALTKIRQYKNGREFKAIFTLALSGSYPAGGEPLDFSLYHFLRKHPDFVTAVGIAGFQYQWDKALNKMIVRVNDAGGANAPMGVHTTAAYAAGVSGDTITVHAIWGN